MNKKLLIFLIGFPLVGITAWFQIINLKEAPTKRLFNKSISAYKDGNYHLALSSINACIKNDSTSPIYYHTRSVIYSALDSLELSLTDINKVIELKPTYDGIYREKAIFNSMAGRTEEAIEDISHQLSIDSSVPYDYFLISQYFEKLEKYDDAVSNIKKAISLDPSEPEFQFSLGMYLYNMDNTLAIDELNSFIIGCVDSIKIDSAKNMIINLGGEPEESLLFRF